MTRNALPWPSRVFSLLLPALCLAGSACAAPDRIAFAVDAAPDGRSRIYVANADGTEGRPVGTGSGRGRSPAFSPDGRSLAYQSVNDLGLDTILVQPLDGEAPRALASGAYPQWSQDGKSILFSRRQLNEYQLHVIRADGSQKETELKPLAKGQIGRWSPDEKRLAAVAPVIVGGQDRWQIQVMPVQTLQPTFRMTLPESYGQVVSLEWHPKGESLLFSTTRQGTYDLYVVELGSLLVRRVPPAESADTVPNPAYGAWSPDGQRILFRSAADPAAGPARLCSVNSDGTDVKLLWEPAERALRIHGTAWQRPQAVVAVQPEPAPPVVQPRPAEPPKPVPLPKPPSARVLGAPRKVHAGKLFSIDQARSPVSVRIAAPGADNWVVSVPLLPLGTWAPRRQGVGVTVELEDGGLYRGNVIYSGSVWATIQGRPRGGKVRLIDGKQLPTAGPAGFKQGFQLAVRREGANFIVSVNGQDLLSRPVLTSGVKSLQLTLENFDTGSARFPLGNVYYRQETEAGNPSAQAR